MRLYGSTIVQRCDEIATTDASQSQLALVRTIQTITVVLSVFVLVQASCTFRCRDRIELVTEMVPTVGVPRPIAQVIESPIMPMRLYDKARAL
jgi:hypothetical protein